MNLDFMRGKIMQDHWHPYEIDTSDYVITRISFLLGVIEVLNTLLLHVKPENFINPPLHPYFDHNQASNLDK